MQKLEYASTRTLLKLSPVDYTKEKICWQLQWQRQQCLFYMNNVDLPAQQQTNEKVKTFDYYQQKNKIMKTKYSLVPFHVNIILSDKKLI